MSLIITIGRQFGSGGRDVGEKVAEYFNIPFYDKELVELAAQKSNISKEALKEVDEHATNSFLACKWQLLNERYKCTDLLRNAYKR